jgi:hypothetical protein
MEQINKFFIALLFLFAFPVSGIFLYCEENWISKNVTNNGNVMRNGG